MSIRDKAWRIAEKLVVGSSELDQQKVDEALKKAAEEGKK